MSFARAVRSFSGSSGRGALVPLPVRRPRLPRGIPIRQLRPASNASIGPSCDCILTPRRQRRALSIPICTRQQRPPQQPANHPILLLAILAIPAGAATCSPLVAAEIVDALDFGVRGAVDAERLGV